MKNLREPNYFPNFVKRLTDMIQYIRKIFVALLLAAAPAAAFQAAASERIEQPEANQSIIKVTPGGELELTALNSTTRFDIYTITGQLVKTLELRNETERVQLPSGCYIVRTQDRSQKIVIR